MSTFHDSLILFIHSYPSASILITESYVHVLRLRLAAWKAECGMCSSSFWCCFNFLLQFGFKNTECFCFLIITDSLISVLPDMPQTSISQESPHCVVPEFIMVLKIAQSAFETDMVFIIRWKSLSGQ